MLHIIKRTRPLGRFLSSTHVASRHTPTGSSYTPPRINGSCHPANGSTGGTGNGSSAWTDCQKDITWNSLDRAYASRADAVTKKDLWIVSGSIGAGLTVWVGLVGGFLAWFVGQESKGVESRHREDLNSLEKRVNDKFDKVEQRFDNVEQRIEKLDDRLTSIQDSITQLTQQQQKKSWW